MTLRLWLVDLTKSMLLMAALGLPLLAAVIWLMQRAGTAWWAYAWLLWIGFNALVLVLYPTVIAPLFNKFEPLRDSGLAERISALLARTGFSSKGVFVMDGSRRSAHGNAYFTGLGRAKRIVFFDTLVDRLSRRDEAVLAHGRHFKLRHTEALAFSSSRASVLGCWAGSSRRRGSTRLGVTPALDAATRAWRSCFSSSCCRFSRSCSLRWRACSRAGMNSKQTPSLRVMRRRRI
jgi:STE24 endopeptidase